MWLSGDSFDIILCLPTNHLYDVVFVSMFCKQSKLKKELKDWQKGFEARVGRPPNDADKSAIEDRFLAYQKVRATSSFVQWVYTMSACCLC